MSIAKQLVLSLSLASALGFAGFSAAQGGGPQALIQPGQQVPAELMLRDAGAAGRELAPLLGHQPVLIVYWQPRNELGEQALGNAAPLMRKLASQVVLFPVAFLGAGQAPSDVGPELEALGLKDLSSRSDNGSMAVIFGLKQIPSFILIDAGGVLRGCGGSDISQNSKDGPSILDAVLAAQRGEAVPTLGFLNSKGQYRTLGRKFGDLNVQDLDGKTARRVNDLIGEKPRTLLIYWHPNCPHCHEALPRLKEWYQKTKPTDLTIIDISRADRDDLKRDAAAFIRDYPWSAHFLDNSTQVGRTLLVDETPSAYLLDATGTVISIQVGGSINWAKWLGPEPLKR